MTNDYVNITDKLLKLLNDRHRLIIETKTIAITTTAGKGKFIIGKDSDLEDAVIFGISMRRASSSRKSVTNGLALANDNFVDSAGITLQHNRTNKILNYPLEYFLHGPEVNDPGDYAQLLMVNGVDLKNSFIESQLTTVAVTNEDVELTFHFMDRELCMELCNNIYR